MAKKKSVKFWVIFWFTSAILLIAWFFYLQDEKIGITSTKKPDKNIAEYHGLEGLDNLLFAENGISNTYLILFENSNELNPGGGRVDYFGIAKMKDGQLLKFEIHNSDEFGARITDKVISPFPYSSAMGINPLRFADSNLSPDFSVNAKIAEELYYIGKGNEKFDGIIGINEIALKQLVPTDYFFDFKKPEEAESILKKIISSEGEQKSILYQKIKENLDRKNIMLYFKNYEAEKAFSFSGWTGLVETAWTRDYLMISNTKLSNLLEDASPNQSFKYVADYSKDLPSANLKITYDNSFSRTDYSSYVLIYVPADSWLITSVNTGRMDFGEEFGKKYFGTTITVPAGKKLEVVYNYSLSKELKEKSYDLLIQKQSGTPGIIGTVNISGVNGGIIEKTINSDRDWIMNGK